MCLPELSWGFRIEYTPERIRFLNFSSFWKLPVFRACGSCFPHQGNSRASSNLSLTWSAWVRLSHGKDSQERTRATQIIQDNCLTLWPLITHAKSPFPSKAQCIQVPGIDCVHLRGKGSVAEQWLKSHYTGRCSEASSCLLWERWKVREPGLGFLWDPAWGCSFFCPAHVQSRMPQIHSELWKWPPLTKVF